MLLTVAGMQVNHTMPKKSASAQLTRKSKASLASPITSQILAAGTTVILSIAIYETSRSPLRFEGSTSSNLTSLAAFGNAAGQRGSSAALRAWLPKNWPVLRNYREPLV